MVIDSLVCASTGKDTPAKAKQITDGNRIVRNSIAGDSGE